MWSLLPTSSPPDINWRCEKPLAEDLMKSLQMAFLSVAVAGPSFSPSWTQAFPSADQEDRNGDRDEEKAIRKSGDALFT